jgi:hypothetical protein
MGIGMGLTMTPMTAAVMSSVPPQRSGMAGATTNASREVGGVFGIALLGAILTAKMKSSLTASLAALGLPAAQQAQIVDAATHGGASGGANVPPAITEAVHSAFVTGMRSALLVAAVALFAGAVLAFTFVRSHVGERRPAEVPSGGSAPQQPPAEEPAVALA